MRQCVFWFFNCWSTHFCHWHIPPHVFNYIFRILYSQVLLCTITFSISVKIITLFNNSESFQILFKQFCVHKNKLIYFVGYLCFACHSFKFALTHAIHCCPFFIANKLLFFLLYCSNIYSYG